MTWQLHEWDDKEGEVEDETSGMIFKKMGNTCSREERVCEGEFSIYVCTLSFCSISEKSEWDVQQTVDLGLGRHWGGGACPLGSCQ